MESILIISSILLWVVVLLNLLLTLGLARRIRNAAFPVMESLKIGQKAPDFSALTLQGKTVTLADYAGHAAAFVFVSPDCKPCREERHAVLLPDRYQWKGTGGGDRYDRAGGENRGARFKQGKEVMGWKVQNTEIEYRIVLMV